MKKHQHKTKTAIQIASSATSPVWSLHPKVQDVHTTTGVVQYEYVYSNQRHAGYKNILSYMGAGAFQARAIMNRLGADLNYVWSLNFDDTQPCDGVLLLGGSDISPNMYGQENMYSDPPNVMRDEVEFLLLAMAERRGLPIFGICRGMQAIATFYGGSLYQDIWREGLTTYHPMQHSIHAYGKMRDVAPSRSVNSRHHQAVDLVPDDFTVIATAHDGIVEGIWKKRVLGVQFHPEDLLHQDIRWINLFRWFLKGLY
jgi:putative glutamine amidotransferase